MDKVYICGICGKKYHTVEGRNLCEHNCIAKAEEVEKEKKKKEREAEKALKQKAIQEHLDSAAKLSEAYFTDYGEMPAVKYSVKGKFESTSKDTNSVLTAKDYYDIFKLLRLF